MDKRTACHILADYNERIDNYYDNLRSVELRLHTCDTQDQGWYKENITHTKEKIKKEERKREDFLNEYSDLIYS